MRGWYGCIKGLHSLTLSYGVIISDCVHVVGALIWGHVCRPEVRIWGQTTLEVPEDIKGGYIVSCIFNLRYGLV